MRPCCRDATACFPVCLSFCFCSIRLRYCIVDISTTQVSLTMPAARWRMQHFFAVNHVIKVVPSQLASLLFFCIFFSINSFYPLQVCLDAIGTDSNSCQLAPHSPRFFVYAALPSRGWNVGVGTFQNLLSVAAILLGWKCCWHLWLCRFQSDSSFSSTWVTPKLMFWVASVVFGAESSSYVTWPIKVFIWVHYTTYSAI